MRLTRTLFALSLAWLSLFTGLKAGLIDNGRLDADSQGWTLWSAGGQAVTSWEASTGIDGSGAVRLDGALEAGVFYQATTAVVGREYVAAAYVRNTVGGQATGTLRVEFKDSWGNLLGDLSAQATDFTAGEDWTLYRARGVAPADTATVAIAVVVDAGSSFQVDNLRLSPVVDLLPVGQFDSSEEHAAWGTYTETELSSQSWNSWEGVGGSGALRVNGGDGFMLLYHEIKVLVGGRYMLCVQARAPSGSGEAALRIEFLNAEGKQQDQLNIVVDGQWREYCFTLEVPDDASTVTAVLMGYNAADVLFDDVRLFGEEVLPDPEPSILPNADLDENLDGWSLGLASGSASATWQADAGLNGEGGVRIEGGYESGSYAVLYASAPAQLNKRYAAGGQFRLAGGSGAGEVKLEFHDAEGSLLADARQAFTATAEWAAVEASLLVPDGAATVTAVFVVPEGSALFADALSLYERPRLVGPTFDFNIGTAGWFTYKKRPEASTERLESGGLGDTGAVQLDGGTQADSLVVFHYSEDAVEELDYTLQANARLLGGSGAGELKIEFRNVNNHLVGQEKLNITVPAEWTAYAVEASAPAGATRVTISLVALSGTTLLFDDVSLLRPELVRPFRNAGFDEGDPTYQYNGGLETQDYWTFEGGNGGHTEFVDEGIDGSKALQVEAVDWLAVYQATDAPIPGRAYTLTAWAKAASGQVTATGELKLEFKDAEGTVIGALGKAVNATDRWQKFSVSMNAPLSGAESTVAVLVGRAGSSILFDDVSIVAGTELEPVIEDHSIDLLTFDLTQRGQTFLGFGAQVWATAPTAEYPLLPQIRADGLRDMGFRYIRFEYLWDAADLQTLQDMRVQTDALGIEWVYMIWSAPTPDMQHSVLNPALLPPENFVNADHRLQDVPGFAAWWVGHVEYLYTHGVPVEYIELMNEPDSGGIWSTAITPEQYNELVTLVRAGLDASTVAGVPNVQIVGPGLASMNSNTDEYILALDAAGNAAVDAWSTHLWEDDVLGPYPEGGNSIVGSWNERFAPFADQKDTELGLAPGGRLKLVTEYATKQNSFHGIYYPAPDAGVAWNEEYVFPYYSATNTVPFAVQSYENTWATLNAGASMAILWQLNDEVDQVIEMKKAWGMVGLQGEQKPIYHAMGSLFPQIERDSTVLLPSDQTENETYGGAVIKDSKVVFGLANQHAYEKQAQVRFEQVVGRLSVVQAKAFVQVHRGAPENGEPDVGEVQNLSVSLVEEGGGRWMVPLTLPADSTVTVVLEILPAGSETFTAWAQARGVSLEVAADPDGDGLGNLLEYALGLDPALADAALGQARITAGEGAQAGTLSLHFQRRNDASDLTYRVETSTNLLDWQTVVPGPGEWLVSPLGGNLESVECRQAIPAEGTLYLRLVVEY